MDLKMVTDENITKGWFKFLKTVAKKFKVMNLNLTII